MSATLEQALAWTSWLAALVCAVAAIELWSVRHAWRDAGVFRWSTLRIEYDTLPRPLRRALDQLFDGRGFAWVVRLQLGLALALPWWSHPLPAWGLVATTLACSVRFRGSYNGGSDAMTMVVLLGLAIARTRTSWAELGLAYIAAQLVLSYFIAGVAKLADRRWRDGTALPALLSIPQYGVPPRARRALTHATVRRAAAGGVLAFECGFPLALVDATACALLATVALAFHVANVALLGLNRFLLAWLAAYPALLFWCSRGG
ncbi:MAG: hypothetical protein IPH07_10615 [Deltaproteobacteria bacterium]|nr:hypothetical protein [Deltaproteobacteria bacterium]MBK8237190.1 hypothetical protein [Deltaproteobacteria bacterium]MBK8718880.1 hypothetical protein [Deltaproteobacteria bacterium]MBP7291684.1 hypothetical protein [Nannocystaceae bacterium]